MPQSHLLTYEQLRRFCPGGRASILQGIAKNSFVLDEYGLRENKLRLVHFLAQAAHETAGFRTLTEYGSSGYFRRRYGHRRDLGNMTKADGAKFRGRGIFQLTGRANYRRFGKILKLDLEADPYLAARPEISLRIACEYWRRHNLNPLAERNDVLTITRRINGGLNGLRDRQRYLKRARSIWSPGVEPAPYKSFLRFGDRGPDVVKLQKRLGARGFIIAIDGLFGRQTSRVLKKFQRAHGLRSDGLYGPRSRKRLVRLTSQIDLSPSQSEKEKNMNQWKSYLLSRTIWANLIGFAALVLDVFGFNGISADDQSQLLDHFLKLVEASGFIAGVVFRAIARDRLGPFLT